MNNEIGEKFLPIGTIVKLKGAKKELMIIGYCIKPKGKIYNAEGEVENTDKTVFDYCACTYPEGLVNSELTMGFNHENIVEVIFKGYESEIQKNYSKFCNEQLKEYIENIPEKLDEKEA